MEVMIAAADRTSGTVGAEAPDVSLEVPGAVFTRTVVGVVWSTQDICSRGGGTGMMGIHILDVDIERAGDTVKLGRDLPRCVGACGTEHDHASGVVQFGVRHFSVGPIVSSERLKA